MAKNMGKDFSGCGTALVTPFTAKEEVDLDAYRRLIRWQVESGADFLVPCGTTGESVTLRDKEYRQVIRTCVEAASGEVPVLAGAGSNSTEHTVHFSRIAQEEGASGVLSVTPYYNKPTQEGLFRHFSTLAGALTIPVVLYNVPGRTSVNLLPETVIRLAGVENIVGVKEASGNLIQVMEIVAARPPGFIVLSGDDGMALNIVALGGDGLISVASNLIPGEMSHMIALARQGNIVESRKIHYRYFRLMQLLFVETSPIPVKYALSRMGRITESYRLPLCPLSDLSKKKVDQELEQLELVTSRV
ncbi:MAG: 4-hydroxy-tetrahydrodipicolinate synthase [Acidobacteriota bacterium]